MLPPAPSHPAALALGTPRHCPTTNAPDSRGALASRFHPWSGGAPPLQSPRPAETTQAWPMGGGGRRWPPAVASLPAPLHTNPAPARRLSPQPTGTQPRASPPQLGPVAFAPVVLPSAQLRRTAARRHRRSSGSCSGGGPRSPRRPGRARMAPAGQPRSSRTAVGGRSFCAHSRVARRLLPVPGAGHATKGRVGGARSPCPPPLRRSHGARSRPRTAPSPPSIMQHADRSGRARMCSSHLRAAPSPASALPALAGLGGSLLRTRQVMSSSSPAGELETPNVCAYICMSADYPLQFV